MSRCFFFVLLFLDCRRLICNGTKTHPNEKKIQKTKRTKKKKTDAQFRIARVTMVLSNKQLQNKRKQNYTIKYKYHTHTTKKKKETPIKIYQKTHTHIFFSDADFTTLPPAQHTLPVAALTPSAPPLSPSPPHPVGNVEMKLSIASLLQPTSPSSSVPPHPFTDFFVFVVLHQTPPSLFPPSIAGAEAFFKPDTHHTHTRV